MLHNETHLKDATIEGNSAELLVAEMEQVFAEVVATAELRSTLTQQQREQARLAIERTMESVRPMIARFSVAIAPLDAIFAESK